VWGQVFHILHVYAYCALGVKAKFRLELELHTSFGQSFCLPAVHGHEKDLCWCQFAATYVTGPRQL
jgi:hypothetical protein